MNKLWFGSACVLVLVLGGLRAEDKPAAAVKAAPGKASVEEKQADKPTPPITPKRFLEIAEQLKNTGKYEPRNGSTFCNWFARDFAKELLGHPLPELNGQANEQITKMTASPDWEKAALVYKEGMTGKNNLKGMTAKELQELQDKGKFVLYCWRHPEWSMEMPRAERVKLHGHIAVGMPLKPGDHLMLDETWGSKEHPVAVPMTAQSGKYVFPYGKMSKGFGAARKNDILVFIYKK